MAATKKTASQATKDAARVEYETTARSVVEIARAAGLTGAAVRKWALQGGWARGPGIVSQVMREARLRALAAHRSGPQAPEQAPPPVAAQQVPRRVLVASVWALGTGERVTGRHGALSAIVIPVE